MRREASWVDLICCTSAVVVVWSFFGYLNRAGSCQDLRPSSAGLHRGPFSCRLRTKAWPFQTVVAQASTESCPPGDSKAARNEVYLFWMVSRMHSLMAVVRIFEEFDFFLLFSVFPFPSPFPSLSFFLFFSLFLFHSLSLEVGPLKSNWRPVSFPQQGLGRIAPAEIKFGVF